MDKAKKIEEVVTALLKVREKKLFIIELVAQIPLKYGELDPAVLAKRQPEVNLAIAEAKAYGSHTLMAIDCLIRLTERSEVDLDLGP